MPSRRPIGGRARRRAVDVERLVEELEAGADKYLEAFVEELLRIRPPVADTLRCAVEDTELNVARTYGRTRWPSNPTASSKASQRPTRIRHSAGASGAASAPRSRTASCGSCCGRCCVASASSRPTDPRRRSDGLGPPWSPRRAGEWCFALLESPRIGERPRLPRWLSPRGMGGKVKGSAL